MKNIVLISTFILNFTSSFGQWGLTGNALTNFGTDFVGTRDQVPLGFRTDLNARMQIFENGPGDFRTGYVGIGNYFSFAPEALMQVYNDWNTNFTSFKASTQPSGFLRNDGFDFGITGGPISIGQIIQNETFPIEIYTHQTALRMHINFDPTILIGVNPITRVAIPEDGTTFQPLSLLHLGLQYDLGFGNNLRGYRTWMDIGTLSGAASEQMYVGLLESDTSNTSQLWNDHMDAVINWGDNVGPADGANNLRFIFTSTNGLFGTASQQSGLETGRFTAIGRLGIGNFASVMEGSGSGIQPYRRLEIYDEGLDAYLNTSAPQLRLTFGPGQTVQTGIWTDFQTTGAGNLFINPSTSISGIPVNGNVGINTTNPAATLEINSNALTPIPGNSGLMFSDLRPTSNIGIGAYGKVLTVDGSGLVVLTDDIGGTGGVSACSGLVSTDENFITKFSLIPGGGITQICRTKGIYESPISPLFSVGIGVGSSPNPAFKLHMKGDLLIERTGGTADGNIYMQNGSGVKRVFSIYGLGGYRSLAIGPNAGPAVLSTSGANRCVYIGGESGINTVSNSNNTFVGDQSGYSMGSTGNSNTFLGTYSAFSMVQGDENVVLGHNAASPFFQQGIGNTILGSQSTTFGMTRGDFNVIIGHAATVGDQFGSNNIIIGTRALGTNGTATLTNAGTIGANGRVQCSDCFTIGAQAGMEQQVGIGVINPATTIIPAPAPPGTAAKLYVSGFRGGTAAAYFAGSVYAPAFTLVSDSSLKQNIQPLTNVDDFINQLEAKTYEFKTQNYPTLNLPTGDHTGFLAHEVEAIAPELVTWVSQPAEYDSSGNLIHQQVDFRTVNYTGLIPVLFTAIKQQQARIDSLVQAVSLCCAQPIAPGSGNRSSINLSNHASIILNQNVPNPFKEKTEISYSILENVKSAAILFYDQSGKILNTYEITHAGDGTLVVYGDNLTGGIYTYSLLINGEPVKTKRMVKE